MPADNKVILSELKKLSKLLAEWNDQIIIGGGVALILYDVVFSKNPAGAVGTMDIDYLIPRKPLRVGDKSISTLLLKNGYELRNKSLDTPSVQSFIRQVKDVEIEIEFLTDAKSRKKADVVSVVGAGVNAQALSYIEMSLNEAMAVTLPGGSRVNVVKPEAWVFHKGLTFPRRSAKQKVLKDLYGIWFVLTQLGDVSQIVSKSIKNLMTKHPSSWEKTFRDNFLTWISTASPRDWVNLERQDPNGKLTKVNFLSCLQTLNIKET